MTLTTGDRCALLLFRGREQKMAWEVAQALEVSCSRARERMLRLERLGLVDISRTGGYAFYRLSDDGTRERARQMR